MPSPSTSIFEEIYRTLRYHQRDYVSVWAEMDLRGPAPKVLVYFGRGGNVAISDLSPWLPSSPGGWDPTTRVFDGFGSWEEYALHSGGLFVQILKYAIPMGFTTDKQKWKVISD